MPEAAAWAGGVVVDDEIEFALHDVVPRREFVVQKMSVSRQRTSARDHHLRFVDGRPDDLPYSPMKSQSQTGVADADMKDPLLREIVSIDVELDPFLVGRRRLSSL
jgi:hypothetical protein